MENCFTCKQVPNLGYLLIVIPNLTFLVNLATKLGLFLQREQDEDGRPIDEEALPEEEEEEEGEENVNPDDTLEEAGENDEEREDPDREVEEVMEEQGDDIDLDNHDEDIISIKGYSKDYLLD